MFFSHYSLHCPLRVGRTLFKQNFFPFSRQTISTTPIRSEIFNIGKRMRSEPYYKKLDKIDPTYELIYRAPFEYLTAFSKHVPTFNVVVMSSIFAYKYAAGIEIIDTTTPFTIGPTMSDGAELYAMAVAFYVINIALAYAVTKYPLRIYKLKKQYVAMFEGFLPFSPRSYSFRKGNLCKTRSILPWHESIYKMKNKTVLVFSHHFKRPADFHDMFRK